MNPDLLEMVNRRLEECRRAYEAGNRGALQDVLLYCQEHELALPQWASGALLEINRAMLTGTASKGNGRHAKWIRQYRQDMMDMDRAETVGECVEHGIPWVDVYEAAELILTGTWAYGKEDAIEKSYKRFKKRQKEQPGRYYILRTVRTPSTAQPLTKERIKMWDRIEEMRKTK